MRGVFPGTGGPSAARGLRRDFLCAGLALSGIALAGILAGSGYALGDDDSTPVPQPAMSNRDFLQNGQQSTPKAKKSNPDSNSEKAEEARISDLIAKRQQEREGEKIVSIVVIGNVTIPTAAILQKLKTQPGRKVTPSQIQEDLRTLIRTRWFITVEPKYRRTDKGTVLVLSVIERPIVRSIEYQGSKEIKVKKLALETGLKVGSPYDMNANKEAAKRLESYYREKGYTEATVDLIKGNKPEERDVVFRIHEGVAQKVVWRYFKGNASISSERLAMELKSTPAYVWIGGKFDPVNLTEDVAAVRTYYANLGFFDAKVEPVVEYSKDRKWIYLKYIVHEGLHYKIRNFTMMGNVRFKSSELLETIKTHEGQFYNAFQIRKDLAKIKKKYDALGYTYMNVEMVPRYLEQPGHIDLLLRVDEDKPYYIRRITVHIDGDHPRTKRGLAYNYIKIAPGELADPSKIEKSKKQLSGAQVFKFDQTGATGPGGPVKIKMSRVTDDKDAADVSYRGQSGDDQPSLLGGPLSPRVPFPDMHVVRKTVPSSEAAASAPGGSEESDPSESFNPYLHGQPADRWTDEVIIRGQNPEDPFLPGNPLFDPTPQGDPFTQVHRSPTGEIDLDYYLSEDRTGKLMFGVGVNSSSGLVGSIVLQEQNFDIMRPPTSWDDIVNGTAWRGAGQRFRIEAVPGTQVSRYTISWSDPYFLNTNNNVGVSAFYFQRYYLDWDEDRVGGRISVGRQLTQTLSVNGALRLEGVRVSDVHVPTPEILQEATGDSFLSTVRGSIIHDTRDMPFLPGEGHRVEVGYEQAFGQFLYPRVDADARQYFTVYQRPDGGGRQILTVGGQMGWTGDNTPIFERFFAGGFQSFRGFAFRGVSPTQEGVYIGGQFMAVGTVEYSVPLLANDMIRLVTFSDFGTVDDGVSFGAFRASVGAGFRISLPMMGPVPLAFDFGIPVVRQQTDITQVFSFYVGLTR
jgi:outer membrane protein insertion porin family